MVKSVRRISLLISVCAIVLVTTAVDAAAQRPALTRDIDNPALAPVRVLIQFSLGQNDTAKVQDSIVVPAGKRLVIENVSVWGITQGSDVITGLWLAPKDVLMFHMLDPTAAESKTVALNSRITAYNRVIKAYFDAGETVQGHLFVEGTTGTKIVNMYLQGYFVTLP